MIREFYWQNSYSNFSFEKVFESCLYVFVFCEAVWKSRRRSVLQRRPSILFSLLILYKFLFEPELKIQYQNRVKMTSDSECSDKKEKILKGKLF